MRFGKCFKVSDTRSITKSLTRIALSDTDRTLELTIANKETKTQVDECKRSGHYNLPPPFAQELLLRIFSIRNIMRVQVPLCELSRQTL